MQNGAAWFAAGVLVLALCRLGLMLSLPLADTTEARYGEIARLTATDGFWLMPHIDLNTPFFAKPPLSTWAAAASMQLFGINEFAARLPSFLVSIAALQIAWQFAAELGLRRRWLVIVVAATSPLFFVSAGAVMTDAVQMAIVSGALFAAWKTLAAPARQARWWRIALWALIGLGALSKGLATWALIGLPLLAYGIAERRPVRLMKQWFSGTGMLVGALIFLPWYLLAQKHYPGFLDYFIVGEHFSRFLVPGWRGDHYGNAHREPIGTIWLFWTVSILPWIGVFIAELGRFLRKPPSAVVPLERFLWCATLAPLAFFTFTRNIIWTYALTALIPFAVLVARWMDGKSLAAHRVIGIGVVVLAAGSVLAAPLISRKTSAKSDRDLINVFVNTADRNAPLIYKVKPSYSSSFYAHGRLRYEPDAPLAPGGGERFIVMASEQFEPEPVPAPSRPFDILFSDRRRTLIRVK